MNGCLLLAARGGSNDEIQREIGDENIVNLFSPLATRIADGSLSLIILSVLVELDVLLQL